MRSIEHVVLFLFSLVFSVSAHAQSSPIPVPEKVNDFAKVRYDGTEDIPDGISYGHLLAVVSGMNSAGQDMGLAMVQSEMNMEEEPASGFLDRMLKAHNDLAESKKSEHRAEVCVGGVPRKYGDQALTVLEDMDDREESISNDHLGAFVSSLNEKDADQFRSWVNDFKKNMVYIKMDHQRYYKTTGKSMDAAIAKLCVDFEREKGAAE